MKIVGRQKENHTAFPRGHVLVEWFSCESEALHFLPGLVGGPWICRRAYATAWPSAVDVTTPLLTAR